MNGTELLLDTNIIIGFLGGHEWAVSFVRASTSSGAAFAVSQITRMELLSLPGMTAAEEERVGGFLSNVDVVGLSEAVERRAIGLRRAQRLKLPDAIIAATAMESGRTLVTCDAKLAKLGVPGLSVHNPRA